MESVLYTAQPPLNSTDPILNHNHTTNNTELYRSVGELVMGSMTLLVIIFMTVTGNVMVILAVFTYHPLKKVQNYFLVSLAAADLMVATLVMPFHVIKFFAGKWVFGLLMCQAWLTFDIFCCTASIMNLCAIALDRYWAITQPIEYANKRTIKLVGGMLMGVWSFSALISIPPLIGWNDWKSNKKLAVTCELTSEKAFVIFSASGSFYIPLLVMTTVYIKIFIAARQRIITNRQRSGAAKMKFAVSTRNPTGKEKVEKMNLHPLTKNGGVNTETAPLTGTGGTGVTPYTQGVEVERGGGKGSQESGSDEEMDEQEPELEPKNSLSRSKMLRTRSVKINMGNLFKKKEKISVSKEKKAAKTLAIIMGVFVLCWLPFFLMYVILPFCESCAASLHPKLVEAITWLGYINSAINPVIYTIFNMDFRRAFQKFLCHNKFIQRRRGR